MLEKCEDLHKSRWKNVIEKIQKRGTLPLIAMQLGGVRRSREGEIFQRRFIQLNTKDAVSEYFDTASSL